MFIWSGFLLHIDSLLGMFIFVEMYYFIKIPIYYIVLVSHYVALTHFKWLRFIFMLLTFISWENFGGIYLFYCNSLFYYFFSQKNKTCINNRYIFIHSNLLILVFIYSFFVFIDQFYFSIWIHNSLIFYFLVSNTAFKTMHFTLDIALFTSQVWVMRLWLLTN